MGRAEHAKRLARVSSALQLSKILFDKTTAASMAHDLPASID